MNIQDYWLQSVLQKQQQASPIVNPALVAAIQEHSHSNMGNPLGEGAQIAKQSSGTELAHKVLKGIGRGISQMGLAGLRASPTESVRQFGAMIPTPAEKEQEEFQKQAFLMNALSKQQAHADEMRYKKSVLDEQRRYHDILGKKYAIKSAVEATEPTPPTSSVLPGVDLSQYPEIKSTKERNDYASTLKGSNMAFNALSNIKNDLDKLKDTTKGNIFSPMGSAIPGINKVKEVASRVILNKELQEEVMLRKRLESQFARLEPVLEKGLKGSAAGEQTLKRFHDLKVYFDSGQPINIIEDRLQELLHEIGETRDVAKLSLLSGRHIDSIPKDYRESIQEVEQQKEMGPSVGNAEIISKVKAIKPGLSDAAILEAQRRLLSEH